MKIQRLLTNLCSTNLQDSKSFYTSLFAFRVDFDSDWFVHLISEGRELELGIIDQNHDVVPKPVRQKVSGMYLTFVVEDVEALHHKAIKLGYEIAQPPKATEYGQNRMLLVAPEGTVCDVSSPIKS